MRRGSFCFKRQAWMRPDGGTGSIATRYTRHAVCAARTRKASATGAARTRAREAAGAARIRPREAAGAARTRPTARRTSKREAAGAPRKVRHCNVAIGHVEV
jgi:hypothetical protein